MRKTIVYRGTTYIGTQEQIERAIEIREIEERTIYKSNVYTYSCRAIRLDDGQIKLIEWFNNGENRTEKLYENENIFWKSI